MQEKTFKLVNRGMNRDLSVSKTGQATAYENYNIRITALDHDTLLSVTNEKGTEEITSCTVQGLICGANVLNNYVILFVHDAAQGVTYRDKIYIVKTDRNPVTPTKIYEGDLNLSQSAPIDSVVYYESEDVQKIYWVDGVNPLRCCNFMDVYSGHASDLFDVNKSVQFPTGITIEKTSSGNARPNGVVQYIITYFNKYGQESGIAWVSDLVYLSPEGRGGAADEYNSSAVKINIPSNTLDTSFTNYRVYSLFRSSLDGTVSTYIVAEDKTSTGATSIVDDGSHLVSIDTNKMLYLGSKPVIAKTISHKDKVLFLGNLQSVGRSTNEDIESVLAYAFRSDHYTSNIVTYYNSSTLGEPSIEYVSNSTLYPYHNQLNKDSGKILSFKSNEKYRFALRFQYADGTMTDAFWIGDKINNTKYPRININTSPVTIDRVVSRVDLDGSVVSSLYELGLRSVQVMIAEATDADRSVKAQGIVNPTMFNVWERYNKRTFAMPSWIARPQNADYAFAHFEVVDQSTWSTGEIQCNYWGNNTVLQDPTYIPEETYGIEQDYDYIMAIYYISRNKPSYNYTFYVSVYKANVENNGWNTLKNLDIDAITDWQYEGDYEVHTQTDIRIRRYRYPYGGYYGHGKSLTSPSKSRPEAHADLGSKLLKDDLGCVWIDYDVLKTICQNTIDNAGDDGDRWFNLFEQEQPSGHIYTSEADALNAGTKSEKRWESAQNVSGIMPGPMAASYYRKNLMYVDRSIVTLDSPEIEYNTSVVDGASYNFRLVGIAQSTSVIADYTVDATSGRESGSNLNSVSLSKLLSNNNAIPGVIAWPLWRDKGLSAKESETIDPETADDNEYDLGNSIVHYWMYMWQRAGSIDGWASPDTVGQYGILNKKVFANYRCSYNTIYFSEPENITIDDIRIADGNSSNQVTLTVDGQSVIYSPRPRIQLTMPGTKKYPSLYSDTLPSSTDYQIYSDKAYLYSSSPVTIEYTTARHAVISLPQYVNSNYHYQEELPVLGNSDSIQERGFDYYSWIDTLYNLKYKVEHPIKVKYTSYDSSVVPYTSPYWFIGELYRDFGSGSADTRYGGISKEAARNCKYIAASEWFKLTDGYDAHIVAYGDTYIQRWDSLRVKPYSSDSVNGVIDIVSAILETHINIDGRTDKMRGISEVASIDTTQFNSINPVYTQQDNFFAGRRLDESSDTDTYSNAITWTLPKSDMAKTDEWMHITLASSLTLDGDKGTINALRRYKNSLLSFQNTGIAEILFNSRTQLSTVEGLPVEVANSGKVDGYNYITNSYGCTSFQKIAEGKKALYFIDNYNYAFCSLAAGNSGRLGITNISKSLGFNVCMKEKYTSYIAGSNAIKLFYDNIQEDVYIVDGLNTVPALAYNEVLDSFTSFYSYNTVSYMCNAIDSGNKNNFISFTRPIISLLDNTSKMWKMHTGNYCNLFGLYKDYWITYRIAPSPTGDKIWTNIDVTADFYDVTNAVSGSFTYRDEDELIDGGDIIRIPPYTGDYQQNEHFTSMKIWNEYQQATVTVSDGNPVKRFRTWRYQVPRADITSTNIYGDDRIRNPWVFIKFTKEVTSSMSTKLMQLHDIDVKYYE